MKTSRFLALLMGVYAVLFILLAFDPIDRATWFVENLTVWIILAVILGLYVRGVRFSKVAYGMMFILVYLHTVGGHYTFSQVPFDYITNLFDFERNHFDRLAHFTVGFYAFAIAEWIHAKQLVRNNFLLWTYPIFCLVTIAATYEIVEWIFAIHASPDAGLAFLGSQGDIWDAQKDMLADTLGAVVAMVIFFSLKRHRK